MPKRVTLLVVLCLGVVPRITAAQETNGASTAASAFRKEARAVRASPGAPAPRVDGRLDDAVWAVVPFFSEFTAKEPVEGAAPRAGTRIAFVYDDDALYVAARMASVTPGDVQVQLTRRDDVEASEVLVISLDTFLDRRTAYSFGVSSAGTRVDYYHPSDAQGSLEEGYDPVWEARAIVDSTGWTAEMRIPFSQLRFTDLPEQVWGLNVQRYAPARNEDLYWVLVPKNETGWSSRFGSLVGIAGIRPSRRIEVVPYGATTSSIRGDRDAGDPFDDGRNLTARGGADLKIGLGSSLTLDATVNPDFGQVEADPAEVNLSAFPTFFSERRPFFAENSDLFQMAGLFYSRRIGAPPHGGASGTFVSRPQNSTILGAAKLTGRLTPSLSIAALGAVTDREYARTFDSATASFGRVRVEPLTSYAATRLVQRFGKSGSTVGFLLTGVHRDLAAGDPLASLLTHIAVSGGSNGTFRFSGGKYEFRWTAAGSYVRGDTAALRRIQQHSSHYLQRPDATEGGYDPTRTSLTGYTVVYRLEKLGGRHWLWDVGGELESPTYEINDLGRLTAADDIDNYLDIRYRENKPSRHLYRYQVSMNSRVGYNFGGVRQATSISINPTFVWKNYLSTLVQAAVDFPATSDALTRGGPLMGTARVFRGSAAFETNDRVATSGEGHVDFRTDDFGGWAYSVSGGLTTRPSGQLSISIEPGFQHSVESRQFLTSRAGGSAATYGRRYIFSYIERSTLSAEIRASYLFKPDLSLEVYAEPFAATGRYYGVGELPAPRSRALRTYGTGGTSLVRGTDGSFQVTDGADQFTLPNPDFNVVSFQSNVVLRWEWRPGSTLFLVWQQDRSGSDPRTGLVGPGRLWDALRSTGDNFLAIKVTYWLSPG